MELRHLRSFLVLAEELHFGRAAQRLHIAQPPLSIQIMQLERELQVTLFDRSNRRVSLTNAGTVFAREAQQILKGIDTAISETRKAHAGETGHLRVGVVSSALYTLFPSVMNRFQAMCPKVEIILKELSSAEQIRALIDEQLDVGILYPLQSPGDISTRCVLTSPVVAAIPSEHPLAQRKKWRFEEVVQERFIVPRRGLEPLLYDTVIALCRDYGFSPRVVQEANTIHSALGMVASSLGIALVPEFARKLRQEGVVFQTLGHRTKTVSLMLAFRAALPSPVVGRFVSCFSAAS